MKKFVILTAAIILSINASCLGQRHRLTVTVATSHQVLSSIQDVEMAAVCGRPTAPVAPLCIGEEFHKGISKKLYNAFEYDRDMALLVRTLPPGTSAVSSTQITDILSRLTTLITSIMADLPKAAQNEIKVKNGVK